ncbi:MAG: ABC transporter permease [Thermoleophilia bacterium]|nr:ABC transporter permease [Thermoleophilia bacterium]
MAIYLAVTDDLFLTWGNVMNVFRAQSVIFILAIGMTFVILTGGLDLSVASAAGFAGMILGLSFKAGMSPVLAVILCAISGILLGVLNGMLIGMVRISPFVVTLGTMSIYTSVILVVTHGSTVSLFNYPKFDAIQTLANQDAGPFPIILLVIVALYLIAWFVLHRTSFGRAVYAVGSNSEAARLNGLNVPVTLMLVYAVAGLTYALGAIQQDGRLTAAVPIVDPNQMLMVIAAVLIGGMSMRGGEGGLLGTFVGVLFLGVIQNGLTLKGVSAFWQGTVTGLILIAAVGLAVVRETGAMHAVRRRVSGRRKAEATGASVD